MVKKIKSTPKDKRTLKILDESMALYQEHFAQNAEAVARLIKIRDEVVQLVKLGFFAGYYIHKETTNT